MARLLLVLLLISGGAFASPALWDHLSQRQHIAPITLMKKIEQRFPGVIGDFGTELKNGQLIYQMEVINPQNKSITELSILASSGKIIKQEYEVIKEDETDKLIVAKQIESKRSSFSKIVQEAIQNHSAQLIDAELDHDLGINYLELELLDNHGKHKLAFDIDKSKPLPLLTWD